MNAKQSGFFVKVGTIIITVAGLLGIAWKGAPYIAKTQTIYDNMDELLHVVDDFHEVMSLVGSMQRKVDSLQFNYVKIDYQNKQLKKLIEYNKEAIKDNMIGHPPFDSIWYRDDFGTWSRIHVRDYFDGELYADDGG